MSESWPTKKLGEICEITSTLVDPRENQFLDLIHIGAGNIESMSGALIELKTAKDEGLISGKFLFDESMVLYSKIRPYLMKAARPDFHGLCSADIYPLKPLPGLVTRDFLFHLLLSNPLHGLCGARLGKSWYAESQSRASIRVPFEATRTE